MALTWGRPSRPQEIKAFLDSNGHAYQKLAPDQQAETVARAIAEGKIVGFFHGRMEFGPRALGGRSILGDPRREDTQRVMNLKIKYRESFRPFAPSVLAEEVSTYFEMDKASPYMLLVAPVREDRRIPGSEHKYGRGHAEHRKPEAQRHPGHHPRGLQRPGPDRAPGDQPPVSTRSSRSSRT